MPAGLASGCPDSAGPAEDPRVTQALEEYLATLEAGQPLDRDRLRERYPDVADVLGEYLDGLEFLHRTAARLQASTCGPYTGVPGEAAPAGAPVPALEDYEVLREVGRGGMGIVYEAVQRSLNRRVALKVLSLGATLDARQLQRFKNEAQAAAHLQHPNVVPVFAVGCEQGVHYYAMRFIEGKTLAEIIRELRRGPSDRPAPSGSTDPVRAQLTDEQTVPGGTGGSPAPVVSRSPDRDTVPTVGLHGAQQGDLRSAGWPGRETGPQQAVRDGAFFRQAAWLGVQAAEGLEHAHQLGVIHRDVKPANLLLDNQGQLWVTDFGLARWAGDAALTMTGDMLGTLRYMSPEQASARRGLVDHRTDVYSLGATLYELVTLQPVCRAGDHRELLQQILHEDPVPPRRLCPNIPRDLETILLKALGKQVEERYATAQELADDLRRFREGQPIRARRPALWERAGRWARRHRPVVVSGVALLLLSVLALAAGTVLISQEQAKTRRAYEQEARARRLEAEARARAEQDFRQARQLVDYIAEIAAVDMAAEADVPAVRRKLLQAALAYYKDFLQRTDDNGLDREELLRGHTRVATILDAIGRPKDARLVWNQVNRIALRLGDGQGIFYLVPTQSRLRLLRLASVQQELKLSPEQVRAVLELASKRTERPRAEQAPNEPARDFEKEALELLQADQARRLGQLRLQQLGIRAFGDDAVTAALQLTPGQRKELAAIRKEAQTPQRLPDGMEERDNESLIKRSLAHLNPEQQSRWRELVGEPFKGVLPPGNLVLAVGALTIDVAPVSATREQKKGSTGPPAPGGRAP
jgi:serine/threonine protein kinase